MAFNIVLRPEAERDIRESVDWYEQQLEKLGERFLFELDFVFSQISNFPNQYPFVFKHYQKAVLFIFPFCIYFTVDGSQIIVLAIHH